MFCPNCGAKNDEGGVFCTSCGSPLNEANYNLSESDMQAYRWNSGVDVQRNQYSQNFPVRQPEQESLFMKILKGILIALGIVFVVLIVLGVIFYKLILKFASWAEDLLILYQIGIIRYYVQMGMMFFSSL